MAHGTLQALLGIAKASLSGYNRDGQYTKYLIFDLISECELAPVVLREVIRTVQVNEETMRHLATVGFLNAVDVADHITRHFHVPFRQSYHIVAEAVRLSDAEGEITLPALNSALNNAGIGKFLDVEDFHQLKIPERNVKLKNHVGGPAPEAVSKAIDAIAKKIEEHKEWLARAAGKVQKAKDELAMVRLSLAMSYMRRGDLGKSKDILKTALDLNPRDKNLRHLLAEGCIRLAEAFGKGDVRRELANWANRLKSSY